MIGVAAAVQLAMVWLGAGLVFGLPSHAILNSRLVSFAIKSHNNRGAGVAAYALAY